MEEVKENAQVKRATVKDLPRNVWAVGFTSLFMDISSEMVINIIPLFLANVLGIKTNIIGLIEGIAEATSSVLKLFSGWLSDKMGGRKWLAVIGYGLSALSKPFFYFANSWGTIAVCVGRTGWGRAYAPLHETRWWPIRCVPIRAAWRLASTVPWIPPAP
jgi:sugar phosphate permease